MSEESWCHQDPGDESSSPGMYLNEHKPDINSTIQIYTFGLLLVVTLYKEGTLSATDQRLNMIFCDIRATKKTTLVQAQRMLERAGPWSCHTFCLAHTTKKKRCEKCRRCHVQAAPWQLNTDQQQTKTGAKAGAEVESWLSSSHTFGRWEIRGEATDPPLLPPFLLLSAQS